jgi:hypothetical protein
MSESKLDLDKFMPEDWQGKYPPCQIQVDAEGGLSHNGAPLVHPKVLEEIFSSVVLEEGRYLLRIGDKTCELEVADTFFTVRRVDLGESGGLRVRLNDDTWHQVDPAGLWLGDNEMIYCRVKDGRFPARFARPAYYQLAQWIEPAEDGYALAVGGRRHLLAGGGRSR